MAIVGPMDLPSVLKVKSDPCKKYVYSKLGFPNVNVEIHEDQFETIMKVAGDFIAGYFPREQRLAVFYTTPLKNTYPLPADAYWIQQCNWDPLTTRIDDVFGAESFLFCLSPAFKILDRYGKLQYLDDWKNNWAAKTPYGNKKLVIRKRDNAKVLPKVRIDFGCGLVEATSNHVLKCDNMWKEFTEVKLNSELVGVENKYRVQNIETFESTDAISVRSTSGAYYGCTSGEPILIH